MRLGFGDVRIVDFSTGIAAAYASKLFADAGADVIHVESPEGDPLRRWSATGADLGGHDGALFRFLRHGQRSVAGHLGKADVDDLVAGADIVVDSAVPPVVEAGTLMRHHPGLVVLSITPYGRTGPYALRPATEFTLQAESGALAVRGQPERPPIMAGGQIGEWVSGTYAAVGAAAAVRRARQTGHGEHVDMSVAELLNLAGTTYTDLVWSQFGRPPVEQSGPARSIETPSIEPTLDGWVGFTTNSRQQFDDFLVLIDRADLLGDERLARHNGRARDQQWMATVRAWTSCRTNAEVVQKASELRIPVAPVGNGATVVDHEQFVDRGAFVEDPTGTFRMPRSPWRLNDTDPPLPRPAPALGQHNGRVEARNRPVPSMGAGAPRLPLDGIRILDLTAWWAGPAAAHALATLGADVVHLESVKRPDGMRMAGGMFRDKDQWWERSAIFLAANTNKRGLTLDLTSEAGLDVACRLIAKCDMILENFTPRVMENFGLSWDVIRGLNPRAIYVRMPAFGLTGPWRDRTGFAQTMEQLTGLAWLTGYRDDQPRIQRGPSDPNAGMHAAFAALVALAERDATGEGQHVEVTMIEGALNAAAEQEVEFSAYGRLLGRDGNRTPTAAPQGLYACRGTEQWLAISVADDEQWSALVDLLGRPAWATDPALATLAGRRAAHDRLDEELGAWAAGQVVEEAVDNLVAAGVAAAPAVDPRTTALHPQFVARRFCETVDHPVAGSHLIPGLPFRFSTVDRWLRTPAPTLGQHNREVLGGILGLSDAEIDALEANGVIGTRPAGL
jgi:crotonobetainyl-CoA:carnitine CoA-transferase CaiB-like acyl-CoA transferase